MATAAKVLTATWETINGSDFLLQPLSGIEFMQVSEEVKMDEATGAFRIPARAQRIALELGLKGWRNFKDDDGNEVFFTGSMAQNIARLQMEDVKEIAIEIISRSQVVEEELKKS